MTPQVELVSGYSQHRSDLEALAQLVAEIRSRPPRERKAARPKQSQHRLGGDEAEQLVADYEAGATIHGLARKYSIRRETVRRHLRRHGVEVRERGLPSEAVAEAARLYSEGDTLAAVGERFGVDERTVATALRKAGVTIRRTQFKPGWRTAQGGSARGC